MDSKFVIKVKHGDTLRRFTTCLGGNGSLDLDMGGLRTKILNLFKFAPDTDLTLTYIDEDNDVVTLVDDDDLLDAIKQCLHPLRINVQTNTTRTERSESRSTSTPMRSARGHSDPSTNINLSVNDAVKSVPELLLNVLSELSHDWASEGAPRSVALTAILECLSKLGLSPNSNPKNGDSENAMDVKVTDGPVASKGFPVITKPNGECTNSIPTKNPKLCANDIVTRGVETWTSAPLITDSIDLNLNLQRDSIMPKYPAASLAILESNGLSSDGIEKIQKESDGHLSGKSIMSGSLFTAPVDFPKPHPSQIFKPPSSVILRSSFLHGANSKQQPSDNGTNSEEQVGHNHQIANGIGRVFHMGVVCDGCGVHPITGPRFKSKVKEDYDLCSICFSEMGNDTEYIKIDHPVSHRFPKFSKILSSPTPHALRGSLVKSLRPKLDNQFIQDVNIKDGTIVAPASTFTKIWRMLNNGSIPWPQGTKLVWTGGAVLTSRVSVELEIPAEGFPVGKELDIAIDFTAPEQPGQYISYWRMASPSGKKFGMRIWVLIQASHSGSFQGLNLNLPPLSCDEKGQDLLDVNMDPVYDTHSETGHTEMFTEFLKAMADKDPNKDQELDSNVNNDLIFNTDFSVSMPPEEPSSVLNSDTGSSSVASSEPSPVSNLPAFPAEAIDNNTMVEETLLKELNEMGFKKIDLNKEILRKNEYNLERSVEELCDVAEWDPILEELQEMGFCDEETNKKLLSKNGGSIKRVVMDLIAGEKEKVN